MLFTEIVDVYSENHRKHVNTFCGKKAEFLNVKADATDGIHCTLSG
jgi:hypothetical protein